MKTEYEIGEKFQCGLVTLECVEKNDMDEDDCNCCIFYDDWEDRCGICLDISGNCSWRDRSDKKNVYFKKVE